VLRREPAGAAARGAGCCSSGGPTARAGCSSRWISPAPWPAVVDQVLVDVDVAALAAVRAPLCARVADGPVLRLRCAGAGSGACGALTACGGCCPRGARRRRGAAARGVGCSWRGDLPSGRRRARSCWPAAR
jgi:hypothetical protein